MKKFYFFIIMLFIALPICAITKEDKDAALQAISDYRLNIKNCPTLFYVASQQLTNLSWTNPGGGDKTFCYARVSGFQNNRQRFDATFIYYIQEKKLEPFSIRVGTKEITRQDLVQKELMKFFSTCSNEVWQEMKRTF